MDEQVSLFCAVTAATPEQAQRFITLADGNVDQAVELFFSNPDLGSSTNASASQPAARTEDHITIDDEDEDDVQIMGSRPTGGPSTEDDEAMARRLQEEMYGGGGREAGGNAMDVDEVRAPMARTTETLVGPSSDWRSDPGAMNAAIFDQMQRRGGRGGRAAPGIFNQRNAPSIWAQDDPSDPEAHRRALSRATGGASDQTAKSNLLAELFRPPFDLISSLSFNDARDEGKENEKWILVNVQDPSIFDCQVLNRDIWKNPSIRDTIKEHFLFLQFNKDDPRGTEYIQYYFATMRDSEDAYPHIAIVDPRTGEQVKTWSGSPSPKPSDFLMDLHEFLDRYSLKMEKKNPVQAKRKAKTKDVGAMTEEEMLEMAMQNSLANGSGPKEEDPDALTRPTNGKGKEPMTDVDDAIDSTPIQPVKEATPFSLISSNNSHEEPTSTDPKETTRIQFRYSGGRVVRRFALSDTVRRIYEWLKAAPLEGKEGAEFELIAMGKNLMEMLDLPIAEAGLKNGTVMVEFIENEE
ncbi:ubx domain-containing protein 2 [Acrodontium crateriforme]|uniref:Ubx domain-containing protein 2 n=1 Tax=Acrodontium crateriforme TaxID=150365 RepID=A0AAQ3RCA7_9PEZI|nr:ubx domain-containing protein 2 [Acrodontium crateriforme]